MANEYDVVYCGAKANLEDDCYLRERRDRFLHPENYQEDYDDDDKHSRHHRSSMTSDFGAWSDFPITDFDDI